MAGGMLHHLGQACRDARTRASVTQLDVATRAGTSHASISRFERGHYWPGDPDALVAAYGTELGIDAIDLWTEAMIRWQQAEGAAD